jgi:3-dehydroquinate synthase
MIRIGSYLGDALRSVVEAALGASDHIVVADARVAALHGLEAVFAATPKWRHIEIEAGEWRKNAADYIALCERLLALGMDRQTVLVAIGGGVTGDLVGFAAATLLRGVRVVQIPTTLLAQMDSSVGGKTGVNMAGGKNLLGAFHQPDLVVVDPAFLRTLPEREYTAGLAETVKYGILGDKDFFFRLLEDAGRLFTRDADALAAAIERSCRLKAGIIGEDELESGRRRLLNLGHTFGHAVEALAGCDGAILHGEAVSVGMAMAARFSEKQGHLHADGADAIESGLARLRLPRRLDDLAAVAGDAIVGALRRRLTTDELPEALGKDKKAAKRGLTLVLPFGIGDCRSVEGIPVAEAAAFMRDFAHCE